MQAMYGKIIIPRKNIDGSLNFLKTHHNIFFSTKKGPRASAKGKHYESLPPVIRKNLEEYIYSLGMALGESSFRTEPLTYKYDKSHENLFERHPDYLVIEDKIIKGLCNDIYERCKANVFFFKQMQTQLPWPRKFQFFEQSIL